LFAKPSISIRGKNTKPFFIPSDETRILVEYYADLMLLYRCWFLQHFPYITCCAGGRI